MNRLLSPLCPTQIDPCYFQFILEATQEGPTLPQMLALGVLVAHAAGPFCPLCCGPFHSPQKKASLSLIQQEWQMTRAHRAPYVEWGTGQFCLQVGTEGKIFHSTTPRGQWNLQDKQTNKQELALVTHSIKSGMRLFSVCCGVMGQVWLPQHPGPGPVCFSTSRSPPPRQERECTGPLFPGKAASRTPVSVAL